MEDRLADLLRHLGLQARVYQSGALCRSARYDAHADAAHLHVLLRGGIELHTRGEARRVIDTPSLVLYMTPTDHEIRPLGEGADLVCASFAFEGGRRSPLAGALPGVVVVPLEDMPSLEEVLSLMFREAGEDHCGRQAVLDRLMELVFVLTLRELIDSGRVAGGLLAGLADRRLARALNAIHAEPAFHWTLESMAVEAGMSRARFASRFREVLGITPAAYLARWRVSVAQSLLRRGVGLELVAGRVGYGSASALARAFRSQTGDTPMNWSRAQRRDPALS